MDTTDARLATDTAMMRLALAEAERAGAMGEVPVGAAVYRLDTGEVLGTGHNVRERDGDPTGHAEIVALRRAASVAGTWRLDGCAMAVTLEPCPMCAGALVNARVTELVYAAADPKMGCVDTLHRLCTDSRFNHRLTVRSGVLSDESAALLKSFFAARRGAR